MTRSPQNSLPPALAGLLDPATYEHRPAAVELRETHISWVLLAGELAFKVKKPLRLPFLDYGSLERRLAFCREEVRLNARLAPEVYRGVRAIVPARGGVRIAAEGTPGAIEHAVEMRRYDEASTLDRRLAAGAAGEEEVRAVGRRLARFHADAEIPEAPERAVGALEAMLDENFETLAGLSVDVDDAKRVAFAMLAGRREELERRARGGRVRDGHGDLRAEHVVLERGIEIVDCVEFDPALRQIDTALDLAFLAMDLRRRDAPLARVLVAAYRDAGGDPGDDALVTFFAAQRALIRAKVALMRAGQVAGADAERRRTTAHDLLELAARLGWELRLGPVAIVCGAAASGKSTLAAALAARSGATVLASDPVRKDLLGLAPTERAPAAAYTPELNRRTYAELGRRVAELAAAGEPVVVDATFRYAADREAFGGAADGAVWIECRAPAEVLARRAAARAKDPQRVSDADAGIATRQLAEWEPLTEIAPAGRVTVPTDRPPEAVVAAARDALDERLASPLRGVIAP
jgi:aminoglycoside phosphotransferase family enzyme/predicted kinase